MNPTGKIDRGVVGNDPGRHAVAGHETESVELDRVDAVLVNQVLERERSRTRRDDPRRRHDLTDDDRLVGVGADQLDRVDISQVLAVVGGGGGHDDLAGALLDPDRPGIPLQVGPPDQLAGGDQTIDQAGIRRQIGAIVGWYKPAP